MEEQAVAAIPGHFSKRATIAGVALAILFPYSTALLLVPFHISFPEKVYLSPFVFWLGVLVLYGYAHRFENRPLLIWKGRKMDFAFFAGSVALLYLLMVAAALIARLPHLFGVHENRELIYKLTAVLKNKYPLLVFTALTAGITEELIFRGYILTRLSLLFSKAWVPVIISALVFSAAHIAYKSLNELIFTFLFGIVCAFYYQKYRDIKAYNTGCG
jgi:membrane protease YdiL (CAAX protease family)